MSGAVSPNRIYLEDAKLSGSKKTRGPERSFRSHPSLHHASVLLLRPTLSSLHRSFSAPPASFKLHCPYTVGIVALQPPLH
jgi:hypothetical protein